jgi:hypothetical protein
MRLATAAIRSVFMHFSEPAGVPVAAARSDAMAAISEVRCSGTAIPVVVIASCDVE